MVSTSGVPSWRGVVCQAHEEEGVTCRNKGQHAGESGELSPIQSCGT